MTDLGPLYHWSPRDRLPSIKRLGLTPGRRPVYGPLYHGTPDEPNVDDNHDIGAGEYRAEHVCFATSPAEAWDLSHRIFRIPGIYDLWQVYLESSDDVQILEQWGAHIREVRVRNRVRKKRLIWIGERTIT